MIRYPVMALLAGLCFSALSEPVELNIDDEYRRLLAAGHYTRAVRVADEMTLLAPESDKARFYLLYANRKAGTPVPDWIDQWPKDESDEYYENLAQEFGLVP